MILKDISGCGLGLRREFLHDLITSKSQPDWLEITPENWLQMPYLFHEDFNKISQEFNFIAHGVSLSLGSPEALNIKFLKKLKAFFKEHKIRHYSEHLSFSSFNGKQSYELLPVPLTYKMASFLSDKVKQVCDYLGMPLILENVSYYYLPAAEIPEYEFINLILYNTGCPLLLDINNAWVNAQNHKFNGRQFIQSLDLAKVAYIHTAGHAYYEDDNLYIDTHGAPVCDGVWDLLEFTLNKINVPVMIERDNNIPPWSEMWKEFSRLKKLISTFYRNENRIKKLA